MSDSFDLSAFLPYRLAVLAERVSRRLSVVYQVRHGLGLAEWRVLVHVRWGNEASVRDIQRAVNLDKPRVSRAVARLVEAGLVEKRPGAEDGRLVAITLSEAGRAVLDEILPEVTAIEARLIAGIAEKDLATFWAVAEKIHATLDADPEARPRSRTERGV